MPDTLLINFSILFKSKNIDNSQIVEFLLETDDSNIRFGFLSNIAELSEAEAIKTPPLLLRFSIESAVFP